MESEALDTKLTRLEITVQRTEFVLTSARREQIKRHLEALKLKAISRETDECKRGVEHKKIANKENLSKINKWHDEIDEKLNKADIEISRLEVWLNNKEKHEKFSAQEEQLKFELKLHETKLKLQTELTTNSSPDTSNTTTITVSEKTAKLPKLMISKFNGSYMDWPRFWGQFSEAVDKSTIAPISKFTYLCELLEPSVKRVVEALPFTPEGYNRAKSILKDRFGKESEIEKAYVKEILELPHITSPSPKKIGEFYEKLSYSVQALKTMKRLDQLKTDDKKPAKESTPDKSQDNSQPENLPKQPNSDKEPQPASNVPPAQDTQPNYQANNQAPELTFTAQQANNGENKPIKDSNPEKSEQNSQNPQQLNPTNGQQQNFAAENLDTKDKQKPIEESAPLKPNLKDGKQQVEDQPKPAANFKPASGVKSKGKSPVGVPAYSYKDLVTQELEAIKDSPSTKQFKADVLKEVQVKLKFGTFPQIDTSKVFVKHKVAKPNRKHSVTKPKQRKGKGNMQPCTRKTKPNMESCTRKAKPNMELCTRKAKPNMESCTSIASYMVKRREGKLQRKRNCIVERRNIILRE
ncbi:Hypothetical predicted protein [Paramuricea clavata]|uniref:Uncharacterized protein n=1 Tax=Paramuricea clavata TaxID=317549 RepID=A0A6S7GEZ9_PARCT|nr:Hypothetical predicted protein [Paramuricea clavata]